MFAELLKRYVGRECEIDTLDHVVKGKIFEVDNNWVKVKTKKDEQIVNVRYIQVVKVIS